MSDGITAETEYACSVALHNGTDLSAYSAPVIVTTQVGAGMYHMLKEEGVCNVLMKHCMFWSK